MCLPHPRARLGLLLGRLLIADTLLIVGLLLFGACLLLSVSNVGLRLLFVFGGHFGFGAAARRRRFRLRAAFGFGRHSASTSSSVSTSTSAGCSSTFVPHYIVSFGLRFDLERSPRCRPLLFSVGRLSACVLLPRRLGDFADWLFVRLRFGGSVPRVAVRLRRPFGLDLLFSFGHLSVGAASLRLAALRSLLLGRLFRRLATSASACSTASACCSSAGSPDPRVGRLLVIGGPLIGGRLFRRRLHGRRLGAPASVIGRGHCIAVDSRRPAARWPITVMISAASPDVDLLLKLQQRLLMPSQGERRRVD